MNFLNLTKDEFISEKEEVENTTEMPKIDSKPVESEVKDDDDTLEKDLFNLIDSMYENKDEEEEN